MSTPTYSFEFFPPKTDKGRERLIGVRNELAQLNPRYFSVTFGAGGSTRDRTLETVADINTAALDVAPHLSCIASTQHEIQHLLNHYQELGVTRLVALRGDRPSGDHARGDFQYASELVTFIRQTTGQHFTIEVAAYPEMHPQAASLDADILHFKQKVEAGADSAITQYFYNIDAYDYFVNRCTQLGVTIPIVPGIMPITNYSKLARFSDACGAEIPRWIRKQLAVYQDDSASIKAFGIDMVTGMCEKLLAAGAPGLHFYSMNNVEPSRTIWQNLGLVAEMKAAV